MAQLRNEELLKLFWILFLTGITVFTLQHSALAIDFLGCDACHIETLDADRSRLYQHSPFAQEECGECHAPLAIKESQGRVVLTDDEAIRNEREKTVWLGDSAMADTSHGFVIPGNKLGKTLVIEARGVDGSFSHQEVAVPLLADLPEVVDGGRAPVISDVGVLKVERGIFLSVTIGWTTDRLADAQVLYGEQELTQSSAASPRFGRRHKVKLDNLRPGRTYRFTAVSKDMFGHRQVSEPSTFSTAKPIAAPEPQHSKDNDIAEIVSQFRRIGADYLLELTLEPPASVFFGSIGKGRLQNLSDGGLASGVEEADGPHAGLNSEIVTTIKACQNCHRNENTATHPVNVFPKPGMVIPPEYPTLPDGRISCVSCHNWHSSEYDYLAFKPGKRELCTGCHRDML
jgi:predicted CXXCH cytochrome family protein